jgi:hypothetical protein
VVTLDDVAALVHARLNGTADSAQTCPGGHWFGRGPDEPAGYPYDVFQIEAGAAEQFSDSVYLQTFTVRLAGYCPVGAVGVKVDAVARLFKDAFVTDLAVSELRELPLRNRTEKVIHARPARDAGEYERELREGRDVFATGLTVELVIQGDSSAN